MLGAGWVMSFAGLSDRIFVMVITMPPGKGGDAPP
jgi:hypothetical protein